MIFGQPSGERLGDLGAAKPSKMDGFSVLLTVWFRLYLGWLIFWSLYSYSRHLAFGVLRVSFAADFLAHSVLHATLYAAIWCGRCSLLFREPKGAADSLPRWSRRIMQPLTQSELPPK